MIDYILDFKNVVICGCTWLMTNEGDWVGVAVQYKHMIGYILDEKKDVICGCTWLITNEGDWAGVAVQGEGEERVILLVTGQPAYFNITAIRSTWKLLNCPIRMNLRITHGLKRADSKDEHENCLMD